MAGLGEVCGLSGGGEFPISSLSRLSSSSRPSIDLLAKKDLEKKVSVDVPQTLHSLLLGGSLLHHVRHVRPDLVDVAVRLHPSGQATVVTVPNLRPLVWPGLKAGVVDALVAVLADQQVLALVRLGRALITDNARLALVTDPAVLLVVVDQLRGVNTTAGVDALAALPARNLGGT